MLATTLRRLIYPKRCTVISVAILSVTVHLARRAFQICVVYCLLLPILVYSAVLQPELLSVYCVHTLYNLCHFQWTVSGTLLICCWFQCNQSCHQFVAKHTLMSFITGLGYFVSWGNYSDQTCFPLVGAVISELLTGASAHLDKHIWPKRKMILYATFTVYMFVVYIRSIESLGIDLCLNLVLSLVCSSGRKP